MFSYPRPADQRVTHMGVMEGCHLILRTLCYTSYFDWILRLERVIEKEFFSRDVYSLFK